jgi:hypothetical protein
MRMLFCSVLFLVLPHSSGISYGMETRINLADPNFEPTDEQLRQLSKSVLPKSAALGGRCNRRCGASPEL